MGAAACRAHAASHDERQTASGSATMSAIHCSGLRPISAARCDGTLPDLAPDERERDLGLLAGEDHLERLDSERAALPVRVIRDPNGFTDPIAVPQREHGDHEPARKLDLVVERSRRASRRLDPRAARAACARAACAAASRNTSSRITGRTTSAPPAASSASRATRTTSRSGSRSAGAMTVTPCVVAAPAAARTRHARPGPLVAGERGDEERDRRLAEPPECIGRGSGDARLSRPLRRRDG